MDVGRVRTVTIEEEMRTSYLDYAMSVIVARALPDVRDGLKPVHRRILYAMHEIGLRSDGPFKKSAAVVGEVLGKYHPHGDAPVYDAMVRMAQDFNMRYVLVDGQGNFGSVDGDRPAAMRYTEARLSALAEEMLADIEKNTVGFTPTYDESRTEPAVLPGKLPNLLVNGSSGIAVGMATNIPPHNLGEVSDALCFVIDRFAACVVRGAPFDLVWARAFGLPVEAGVLTAAAQKLPAERRQELATQAGLSARRVDPAALGQALLRWLDDQVDVTPEELGRFVKGPDFPTAGIIVGVDGLKSAYATGHGRIVIRARAHIDEPRAGRFQIVVTELPYQVNKAALIEKMADLVRDKRIDGVAELRDESDREGMRVVVEVKRDVQPRKLLNQLYKHTAMQTAFSVNMLALVDGQPRVLTLKAALLNYVNFRRDVVTRRTQFDLDKALQRAHVLEGLKIALDNLDAVIRTIREARDAEAARHALMRQFKLTQVQAQAILETQLRRLASLERRKILDELKEVRELVAKLEDLVTHPVKILAVVRDELQDLKKRFGDARRTRILPQEAQEFTEEDLIPDVEVVVTVSGRGYVKRLPASTYRVQRRGGRGVTGMVMREDDALRHVLVANTHDSLLFFTERGRVFQTKVHEVPDASRQARGLPLTNVIGIEAGETVTATVAVRRFVEGQHFLLATRRGEVKRVAVSQFAAVRSNGLIAMSLEPDDELCWVRLCRPDQHAIGVTRSGQALRFACNEVRVSARASGGIRGVRLASGDAVAGFDIVRPNGDLLIVTSRGYGKRTPLEQFPLHHRGGGGVRALAISDRVGPVVLVRSVLLSDEVVLVSAEGLVIRQAVAEISRRGRAAGGVQVMNMDGSDTVVALARLDGRAIERASAPPDETAGSEEPAEPPPARPAPGKPSAKS